ncbi:SDR family oxidoreductase [Prosthecomicrobium pneumaticum]|uniref:2-keto-3-deoxy-L-fuconate dehydrogenase n=1 Tax=Prosthecomicrobium pneumaticum TaxID=81895 RepID=A0A7W9FM92_9HYPH|nr:SDR family oxidoreductase [Prosthecomicrobium pneumaticum]MBB5753288.1 2-keto-3-deoxy-L-fuconate dehydrogenase [Prosthecomicrobium pneumaticum]
MVDRLKDKLCVVTAAAQGIGRATVEAFSREGARIVATDVNEETLAALAGIPNVTTRKLDVLDAAAIAAFAAETGAPDVLFNCAGIVHAGTILEASEADWERAFDLNARSMFRLIKAFLPAMVANGGASIVNIASVAGVPMGVTNRFVYSASKAAVIGLTRSIAIDFIKDGIRCNAICPGTVESPSLEGRMHATGDYDKARAAFIARQPIGRLGKAEEIAAIAVHLASDESGYTTGQWFTADGGMSL